jgi:predicted transcriptional regulator
MIPKLMEKNKMDKVTPLELNGRTIAAARKLLRWTQHDLASRAGVSLPSIVKMETETANPLRSTERAIRETLMANGIRFDVEPGRIGVSISI